MSRRHPYQRIAFLAIVAACWVLGLFGLDRSRMSSFQLPIVVGAGFVGYWVVVAVRRRLDTREEVAHEIREPQTCVVVRRLGEIRARDTVRPVPPPPPPPPQPEPVTQPRAEAAPVLRPARRRPPERDYIPLSG